MTDAKVTVKTGGTEVIDSGVITAFPGEPIEFFLDHKNEENELSLKINFRRDEDDPRMETDVISKTSVEFDVYNHGEGLAIGPDEPFMLGTLGNHPLYFIYQVDVKPADKFDTTILQYTFYIGEEEGEVIHNGRK